MEFIKRISLLIIFLSCAPTNQAEVLTLKLMRLNESSIMVLVANESFKTLNTTYDFDLSPMGKLSFTIIDVHDKNYPISVHLRGVADKEPISLGSYEVIGKVFTIDELSKYHGLTSNSYKLKYQLCNNNIDKEECKESNSIKVNL